MTTVKAVRIVFPLGNLEIEGFQMPDGKYQLSQSSVTSAVGKPAKRMVQLTRSEAGQSLLALGFEKGLKCAVEGSKPVTLVSLEVAFQFWALELSIGNTQALGLVVACGVETLERRLDLACGIVRSEQERNTRLGVRRDSIISRHFWTDCIETYIKHNEVSDNYKKWVYINVSDLLNLSMFGLTSKQLREHYQCGDQSPRDWLPSDTLKLVDAIEKAVGVRVKKTNSEPRQALKDMLCFMGIEADIALL